VIAIRSLRVAFGQTIALDLPQVDVGPGITGLFGPNASGKTTLLRVLAGLLRPTAGTVTFRGRRVSSSSEDYRALVGFAGHESGLYPRLTLAENLRLFARLYGVSQDAADRVIDDLQLARHVSELVGVLSAGVKRRAAVARALLHDPEVLLLDEPYANVDDEAAAYISMSLRAWRRDDRLAVVATHGAKKVKAFADAGIILRRGQVVVAGTYRGAWQAARP
jgi:heme exporter protein A